MEKVEAFSTVKITPTEIVRQLPPLAFTVQSLRASVGVPDQKQRMTVDIFICKGHKPFRWPLTPMQYVLISEEIAAAVSLPLDEVVVLNVDPLSEGHTFDGETANHINLPDRFYENNRPPYEKYIGDYPVKDR